MSFNSTYVSTDTPIYSFLIVLFLVNFDELYISARKLFIYSTLPSVESEPFSNLVFLSLFPEPPSPLRFLLYLHSDHHYSLPLSFNTLPHVPFHPSMHLISIWLLSSFTNVFFVSNKKNTMYCMNAMFQCIN